jgi:hypothetical protein
MHPSRRQLQGLGPEIFGCAASKKGLVEAAKANRHGHRDATMILLAFRHGLRAAELCDLR